MTPDRRVSAATSVAKRPTARRAGRSGLSTQSEIEVRGRTARVAHYIITHTRPEKLGAVKLNKVMWHADVLHYRRYGETVTGQISYVRMDMGPVPHDMRLILDELKTAGKIVEKKTPTPVGERREFVCLQRAKGDMFSALEIETLHEAMRDIVHLSAREASNRTHGPIWKVLDNGQDMPVQAAAVIPSEICPEDIEFAMENKERFDDGHISSSVRVSDKDSSDSR